MNALKKLIADCENMDMLNQLATFDDAFLPAKAAAEFAELESIKTQALIFINIFDSGGAYGKEIAKLRNTLKAGTE